MPIKGDTMTRVIVRSLALGFVALVMATRAAQPQPSERPGGTRPPNIVFVIADQWRYEAFGYAGNPDVKTPNLDRLQREGVRNINAVNEAIGPATPWYVKLGMEAPA